MLVHRSAISLLVKYMRLARWNVYEKWLKNNFCFSSNSKACQGAAHLVISCQDRFSWIMTSLHLCVLFATCYDSSIESDARLAWWWSPEVMDVLRRWIVMGGSKMNKRKAWWGYSWLIQPSLWKFSVSVKFCSRFARGTGAWVSQIREQNERKWLGELKWGFSHFGLNLVKWIWACVGARFFLFKLVWWIWALVIIWVVIFGLVPC